jgi:hypothetical protein
MPDWYIDDDGDEVLIDDDGNAVGYIAMAPDGAMVLTDGVQVLAASTPDGQQLDHSEYHLGDNTDDTGTDELDTRIAALEQQQQLEYEQTMENARAAGHAQYQAGRDHDAVVRDVEAQTASLGNMIGRTLTTSEARRIAEVVGNEVAAGREPDVFTAVNQLEAEGRGLTDIGSVQGKIDLATAYVDEARNTAQGREADDNRARAAEHYDLSTTNGKTDAVLDQLAGHDFTGRTYDSRELE